MAAGSTLKKEISRELGMAWDVVIGVRAREERREDGAVVRVVRLLVLVVGGVFVFVGDCEDDRVCRDGVMACFLAGDDMTSRFGDVMVTDVLDVS